MKNPTSLFTCRINLSKRRGNYRRVRQGASTQIHQKLIKIWNNSYKTTSHFSSITQSCLILHDPTDHNMPGLPVHPQLPDYTQTHAHCGGDAIQPSHPQSSPSPLGFNTSQGQDLFKWVSSSHQVAKVLDFQLQHQSFQWTLRTNLL